jgi:hypothetical protein
MCCVYATIYCVFFFLWFFFQLFVYEWFERLCCVGSIFLLFLFTISTVIIIIIIFCLIIYFCIFETFEINLVQSQTKQHQTKRRILNIYLIEFWNFTGNRKKKSNLPLGSYFNSIFPFLLTLPLFSILFNCC